MMSRNSSKTPKTPKVPKENNKRDTLQIGSADLEVSSTHLLKPSPLTALFLRFLID